MRQRPLGFAVLGAWLALSAAAPAMEKASPEDRRRRQTSTLEEYSARPLYLFSLRGRPDPFVIFPYRQAAIKAPAKPSITELALTGYIGSGSEAVALFVHRLSRTNYTLRGSRLFTPDNKVVEDVRGKVLPNREVSLQQGDKSLVFSSFQARSR
jgi:hypothetical protein